MKQHLCKVITVKSVITIAQVQEYGKENTLHLGQRYSVSLGCFGGDKTEYGAYDDHDMMKADDF